MNATHDEAEQPGTSPQTLVAAGVIVLGIGCLYAVSQGTVSPGPAYFAAMVQVLVGESMRVLLWLAGAAGWGRAVWRAAGGARGQWAIAMALGVGVMAMWDWALGLGGWLNVNTAWATAGLGWALLAAWAYRRREQWYQRPERWPMLPWAVLPAVPAVALMLGACTIPPGVMWVTAGHSEGGGYDVLSYHLQLPKQWIADGAIAGYEHNVYSYLPNLFEAAYMHLGLWAGSMVGGAYAAQLLHASTAMITAAAVAQVVIAHTARPMAGAFAAAAYLAVPWTVVTGSMAYNEQMIAAVGVAALGLAMSRARPGGTIGFGAAVDAVELETRNPDPETRGGFAAHAARTGLIIGALVGLATLAKLPAIGMYGLPIALVLIIRRGDGWPAWATRGAAAALAGCIVLAPWLIRNHAWTANAVFPLLADRLGTGHWTLEQAQRWNAATHPPVGFIETIGHAWTMGPAHPQFGYVLWPAVAAALGVSLLDRTVRRAAAMIAIVLVAQLLFWMFATHHQSRFLVPMVGPGCVAIGLAVGVWRWWHHAARIAAGLVFIGALTAADYALYIGDHGERGPLSIDGIELLTRPYRSQAFTVDAAVNALPPDARVYAEAYARPFYILRSIDYHTVWDRSPLGVALAEGGPKAAHDWLRRRGYTHVVIDWQMLGIWLSNDNYGYDPNVKPDQLAELAATYLTPQWPPPDAPPVVVLYRVR